MIKNKMLTTIIFLIFVFGSFGDAAPLLKKIDFILIEKSKRLMTVYHQGTPEKTYTISLGFSPIGSKQQTGDGKTPEGTYYIEAKNANSQFYRSLKISYPSMQDRKRAAAQGVSPGGDIMIHGLKRGFSWLGKLHTWKDWTLGCIAVTNTEIKEIFDSTPIGIPVKIIP